MVARLSSKAGRVLGDVPSSAGAMTAALEKIANVLQKMNVETLERHVWAHLKALCLLYSKFNAYLRLAIPLDQHKSAVVAGDGQGVGFAVGRLVAQVVFIFVFKWATDIAQQRTKVS